MAHLDAEWLHAEETDKFIQKRRLPSEKLPN